MPLSKKPQPRYGAQAAKKQEKTKGASLKDIQVPNWVAIVTILVAVLVIACVFFLNRPDNILETPAAAPPNSTQTADAPAPDATQVETLPQNVRNFDSSQDKNPFGAEKLGAVTVTGIVSSDQGKSTAILEAGGASFVVSEGDMLPQSAWSVKTISGDSVTLSCDTSEKTFYMAKRGAASSAIK